MLCTGVITLAQATARDSIDYETLFLLFGMMVVVGFLRLSGFFTRLTHWSLDRIDSPKGLLAMVILLSGILSAFLVNDIVCLALTPLVIHLTKKLGYKRVPHLIGAGHCGKHRLDRHDHRKSTEHVHRRSFATFPTIHFAIHLMPVALLGLIVDYFVIFFFTTAALSRPRLPVGAEAR